jgi:hypothetical protein
MDYWRSCRPKFRLVPLSLLHTLNVWYCHRTQANNDIGSAVLIELAKAFSSLTKTGWKPARTIVLCSWDAEEYGLVGR